MDKNKRIQITNAIDDITDKHCKNCNDPSRYTDSKETNIKYCSNICVHGKNLKKLGDMLLGKEKVEVIKENKPEEPSKESYLLYKERGKTDKEISEKWGINPNNQLYYLKKKWGLIGKFGPKNKKATPVNKETVDENSKLKNVIEELTSQKLQLENQLSEVENTKEQMKAAINDFLSYQTMYLDAKERLEQLIK